jgi:hypothetical protein
MLAPTDYEITEAEDGEQALQLNIHQDEIGSRR